MAVGDLAIRIRAETAEFEGDMGRAAHVTEREMERMVARANAAGELIGRGVSAIAGHVSRMVAETLKAGDELNKLSQRSGMAVGTLSELKFAGQLADVSFTTLQSSLGMFNKALAEALNEGSRMGQIFRSLGVDVEAGPTKAFEQFAKAINQLPDGETKAAAMRAVFKQSGDALIPMIAQLEEARAKAQALGIVMTAELARDSERFNDAITSLKASSQALMITALTPMSGALSTIAENMVTAKERGTSFRDVIIELGKVAIATQAEILGFAVGFKSAIERASQAAFNALERWRSGGPAGPSWGDSEERSGFMGPTMPPDMQRLREAIARMKEGAERAARGGRAPRDTTERDRERQIAELRRQHEAEIRGHQYLRDEIRKIDEEAEEARNEQIERQRRRQEEELRAHLYLAREVEKFNKDAAKEAAKAEDEVRKLGLTFASAFEDAVIGGKKLRDVLNGIAQVIARMLLRKQVTEPLANAIGGMFKSGGGSIFDRLFGSSTPAPAPATEGAWDLVGGAAGFARGTDYVPRTGLALVHQGEAIVPASRNSGRDVTIIQHMTFGSDVSQATLRAWAEIVRRQTIAAIPDATRRGGGYSKAVRGRGGA